VTVIRPRDGLDFAAAPALRELLIDVLHRGTDPLVLDLSQVAVCDAAGLAVLIGTQRRAGLRGVTMRLVAPSRVVTTVLRATGLEHSFAIFPDLPAALAPAEHEAVGQAPALAAASSF
jgi:anti-anti-sigma factor